MDTPQFTLSQVADAAGVPVGTLRSWLQRKHWQMDMAIGDSPSEVAGKAHMITLRRALQIGLAVELVRNEMEPARAFQAAREFSHLSNHLEYGRAERDPGEIFEYPILTVLFVPPAPGRARVQGVDEATSAFALLAVEQSVVIANVNKVDRRMRIALLQNGKGAI